MKEKVNLERLYQGKAFRLERKGDVAIATFDLDGERVNKIGFEAADDLKKIVQMVKGSSAKSFLLRSAKKQSFVVGADINLIKSLGGIEDARKASSTGQAVFSELEDLKIPTLAAIEGPCMGGGTEMVLACRYRMGSDFEKTSIGLPEVKLGFLPGWGGTYRLPRLIGLTRALDLILTGKAPDSKKAHKLGLLDWVVPSASFEDMAVQFAEQLARGEIPRGRKEVKLSLSESLMGNFFLGRMVVFSQARKTVLKQTRGHYPAPLKILSLLDQTAGLEREAHMALEASAFAELWATSESKNLVNLFFLMEDAKKRNTTALSETAIAALPAIREVGLLGAGVMGGGIAAQAADSGFPILVKDLNFDALGKALGHARSLFDKKVFRRRLKASDRDRKMGLIRAQTDFTHFEAVDLVIEAIVENMDIKKKVFAELETVVSSNCILASNTSSLRLTDMGSGLKDPSRFVGIHFFNPVDKMPLVEVIVHAKTSDEVVAKTVKWVRAIGKTPVVVKDGPGFLVNRLLMPWLNEAAYLLLEGHSIERLDRLAKSFGMPMGPCELLDEIGLDVAAKVAHILEKDFGARAKAAVASDRMVEAKRLGRKGGLGFYTWDRPGGKRLQPDQPGVSSILFTSSPPQSPKLSDEALVQRMFYPMINEAARAMEEGIVGTPQDCDLAMIFGTGFPPFRGGLLRYADSVGLKNVVAELERLRSIGGERLAPSGALMKLAQGTNRFYV